MQNFAISKNVEMKEEYFSNNSFPRGKPRVISTYIRSEIPKRDTEIKGITRIVLGLWAVEIMNKNFRVRITVIIPIVNVKKYI